MKSHFYHEQILEICLHEHLTVDEIFARLAKDNPEAGRSTVYRNVEELVKKNELKKITGVGKKSLFETTKGHHAHFICKDDGTVSDIEFPDIDLSAYGFDCEIEDVDLRIYGRKKK